MKKCKLFLLFLFFSSNFFGQNNLSKTTIGIPKITQFLPNDYNGEAQNFNFIQDEKGILYVANTVGFLEFNGVKWRSFKPTNDGVPFSFTKDEKGRIYVGGSGFIGFLDKNAKGETYFVSLKDKLPKDFFIGFVWDCYYVNNKVYFKNDTTIICYDGEKIEILKSSSPIQTLLFCDNKIFIDTQKGIYQLTDNKFVFVDGTAKFGSITVRSIIKNPKDFSLTIATLKNGLFTLKNKKPTKIKSNLSRFLKENLLAYITVLNDKNIAISTIKGGLIIVDSSLEPLYRFSEKSGLNNNNVKRVQQDVHQNLWIGTDVGIAKINYPITTTFYNKNKEKLGTVEEITSYKNDLYIGTSLGTFKLNPIPKSELLTENHFAQFSHLPKDAINSYANLVVNDKLLFGGLNKMMAYDGKTTTKINSLNPRKIYKSLQYPNVLFVGHTSGCAILFLDKKGTIISTTKIKGINAEIRGVAEDKENNLWLASVSNGIYKVKLHPNFKVDTIIQYTEKDGLPSMRDNLLYHIDKNEVLFTTHKGLYTFNKTTNRFISDTRFGQKYAGGKDEFVYAFNFDSKQQAWIHSFRKKETVVATLDDNGEYQINNKDFTEVNQMQIYEILSEPNKGVTWFGGSEGFARYEKPKLLQKKDTIFYAVISKVLSTNDSLIVGGHQFDKNKKVALISKDIRFEVGATDFQDISKNQFQYFLEGYDTKWSDWSTEAFKIYTNLNYGNYIFKVRAKNVVATISVIDYFSFTILPKWYETLWAIVLFLGLLILLIIYITKYFSKRKFVKKVHQIELVQKYETEKSQAIILEQEKGIKAMIDAQENERSRIARELHDGVVQQIGSVILKARTLINTPASKELIKNLEESNQDLRNISHQMMPRALKELGIVHALKDLLESSLQYAGITYSFEHFNITERLPKNIEITIYRVTQELVNNIIKHSKAAEVSVQLFVSGEFVILIVEDNGIGISSEKPKKGIGLLNIASRLDMVKGTVNFEPSPKSGTLVTLKIPIK